MSNALHSPPESLHAQSESRGSSIEPRGRLVQRSHALAAHRAELGAAMAQRRATTIYDWSVAGTAPAVQLRAFDHAMGDLHDAVAVGNHEVWGDPLPAHLEGAVQRRSAEERDPTHEVHAVARGGLAGAESRLPHLETIQASFGRHDVRGVAAHLDGRAAAASRVLGAHAYASGDAVAFRSAPDLFTAAHEAAHVVQQRSGVALSDGLGRAGDRYEVHADEVAQLVVRGASAEGALDRMVGAGRGAAPAAVAVQRRADAAESTYEHVAEGAREPAVGSEKKPAAESEKEEARADTRAMPDVFGSEVVLEAWVANLNRALRESKNRGKLATFKARGWANDEGLQVELLKDAAARWESRAEAKAKRKKKGKAAEAAVAPPPTDLMARVFQMMTEVGGLRGLLTDGYRGKCWQFSNKMVGDLGAERTDGKTRSEHRDVGMDHLRGKRITELPSDLPAGYQIGVTSRPEWPFSEVGNHWFVSLGKGFFADQTVGITDGAGMTSNLKRTTAEQWAGRVLGPHRARKADRAAAQARFLAENPQFESYRDLGKNGADPARVEAARAEIIAFVKGRWDRYQPRIWAVARTQKAT